MLVRKISLGEDILKYAYNMDLKSKTDGLNENISKK
jgi:hypothetical protein